MKTKSIYLFIVLMFAGCMTDRDTITSGQTALLDSDQAPHIERKAVVVNDRFSSPVAIKS